MPEQSSLVHRHWDSQYHHGHYGTAFTNTHGLEASNGQIAQDYVDPAFQRRFYVRIATSFQYVFELMTELVHV